MIQKRLADPALTPGMLLRRDASGGVPALFDGRAHSYAYNTRVAIRKAVDHLELQSGDEVLVPAYNCGSEVDPLYDAGLAVQLYPVPMTTHIDPAAIAERITPRTRAIYLIHYFGVIQPQTLAIRDLCDAHDLRLIEDCALSLLSGSQPANGRAGDVSVFCLYKFFPVLGGGVFVANGPNPDATPVRFGGQRPFKMRLKEWVRVGLGATLGPGKISDLRARLSDRNATEADAPSGPEDMPGHYYFDTRLKDAPIDPLGRWPLKSFDIPRIIATRKDNFAAYLSALADLEDVQPLFGHLPSDAVPLCFPVLVDNRDLVAKRLTDAGVPATRWWSGTHRSLDLSSFSAAQALKDRMICLPLHQNLNRADIAVICNALRAAIAP